MSIRRAQSGFTLFELMVTLGIFGVVSAFSVPMIGNAMANFRVAGDSRDVSNAAALAKMRATSSFSQARLFVDVGSGAHHMDVWDRTTSKWTTEGGSTNLSQGTSFSFGAVGSAPPNTQVTIAQAPQCTDNAGANIGNTACIVFNSRGLPVNAAGIPVALDAVYLTNGTDVYGITVAATGMIRMWRAPAVSTPAWVLQ